MKKYLYYVERRGANGEFEGDDFVKAANLKEAMTEYCETKFYPEAEITESRVLSRPVLTAKYPEETAGYIEISKYLQQ